MSINSSIKYFLIFILLILILIIFFLYFKNNVVNTTVSEFTENYYILPLDKKGKKIPNLYKKVLNSNSNENKFLPKKDELIKYSIQFHTSTNYVESRKKLNYYLKKNIFNQSDFLIVSFDHTLGREYLLIYKNFETRKSALEHCSKYLNFISNCIIVNVQNMN